MAPSSLLRSLSSFFAAESGLPNGKQARGLACEGDEEEEGLWSYLVVNPEPAKRGASRRPEARLREGMIVSVDRRVVSGWMSWLHLSESDEWIHDICSQERIVRLVEVVEEQPPLSVKVLAKASVSARPMLEVSSKKVQSILEVGEIVKIAKCIRVIGRCVEFLALENDGGWVCNYRDGEGPLCYHELRPEADEAGRPCNLQDLKCRSGSWCYMVIDPAGITYRHHGQKRILLEGDVVEVTQTKPGREALLLQAEDGAWLPTIAPSSSGGGHRVTMAEVLLEEGSFQYVVMAEKGVAIRSRPSFLQSSKVRLGPKCGEIVSVCQRVVCGETRFLKLEGGKGWLFDIKHGRRVMMECTSDGSKALLCPSPTASQNQTRLGPATPTFLERHGPGPLGIGSSFKAGLKRDGWSTPTKPASIAAMPDTLDQLSEVQAQPPLAELLSGKPHGLRRNGSSASTSISEASTCFTDRGCRTSVSAAGAPGGMAALPQSQLPAPMSSQASVWALLRANDLLPMGPAAAVDMMEGTLSSVSESTLRGVAGSCEDGQPDAAFLGLPSQEMIVAAE